MSVTLTQARQTLFSLVKRATEDHEPITITSRGGSVVLVSADDYAALEETAYLLRSPANARRLLGAIERTNAGQYTEHGLPQL